MDKGVRNYEKFMQLFGKDKATGRHAETASEMRHRRANNEGIEIGDHVSANTIDGIDFKAS